MSSRLRVVGALLAVSLVAASCGEDDDTADTTASDTETTAGEEETTEGADTADTVTEDTTADAAEDTAADTATDTAEDEADTTDDEAVDEDCSGTYTFDSYSGEVEVPRNPETIAVYDMGILTSLSELGVPLDAEDGVATLGTPMPDDVQSVVDGMTSLGSVWEPDLEALNALEPDLIIVASRSSQFYPDFVDLGLAPVVDLTSFDDSNPGPDGTAPVDFVEEFERTHRSIGEIFCVQDGVESVITDIESTIAEVNAAAPDAGDALVLVTTGSEVGAFGPGAFRFGQVFDTYGFTAADDSIAENETHGEPVSFEFIAEAEPDMLFVVDRAAATGEEGEAAEAILDNALVNTTPAAQNDDIVYVDSFDWYIVFNGIRGVQGVAEELAAAVS